MQGLWLAIGTTAAGAALASCSADAPAAAANASGESAAPAPQAPGAAAPMAQWITGTWSFDSSCTTDFVIRYEADGKLDNAGEVGSWKLDGDQLVETLTERFENGGAAPMKLDPPVTRRYSVQRIDDGRGMIRFEGRDVPIQRC
jgi:hypothetical protein